MSRITMNDVRRAGHCPRGTRDWFAEHGLDFRDFIANGIDESVFIATGDANALQVVAHKKALNNG